MATILSSARGSASFQSSSLSSQRLPFQLHDFTRLSWVNDKARETWQPRFQRIANAWSKIEWLAIAEGIRQCCITTINPEEFVHISPIWAKYGLTSLPLQMVDSGNTYSSTSTPPKPGGPFSYRMVVGSMEHVSSFRAHWDSTDNMSMGNMLGYPNCCRAFFERVWVEQKCVDTTWSMAAETNDRKQEAAVIELNTPSTSNILWRWMGPRPVSHLPCSFACAKTMEVASSFLGVGRAHGFNAEMDWLLSVLDWPVEWTALHGIAEIKTPILKVVTRTDATSTKFIVRYMGRSVPGESACGLSFPFNTSDASRFTGSDSYRRGLDNPLNILSFEETAIQDLSDKHRLAADNGFNSVHAMDESHSPIIQLSDRVLRNGGNVLDLGCGNGMLLQRLRERNPEIIPFGIESDASRIENASRVLPGYAENIVLGDMFTDNEIVRNGRRYSLVLLMPGRLLEVPREKRRYLLEWLKNSCDHILIYVYKDYAANFGSLSEIAKAAGLSPVDSDGGEITGRWVAFAEVVDIDGISDVTGKIGEHQNDGGLDHSILANVRLQSRIDWHRMASPQSDDYDSAAILEIVNNDRHPSHSKDNVFFKDSFFDRAVGLVLWSRQQGGGWPEQFKEADPAHPNLERASALLKLWPEAYRQIKLLVRKVYIIDDGSSFDAVVGSCCGSGEEGFGVIVSTINHHVGFAEALVHEMAHHKLRAIGVEFESATRIIENKPEEKYPSPIRYDCLRPMSAVLHAQYSYTYIAALDNAIIQNSREDSRNERIVRDSLAVIIPKLEFGLETLRRYGKFDEAGESFIEGLYKWTDCIVAEADAILREFRVAKQQFSHPIQ